MYDELCVRSIAADSSPVSQRTGYRTTTDDDDDEMNNDIVLCNKTN